ncbi:MAG: HAD hydrolase-like protein [Rickettsiales bacterium]|jgi:FMN phosphatase YigB (HAD superfamily)|nr:HAD hydrolase-like protein [Rickettsiales bacterium]
MYRASGFDVDAIVFDFDNTLVDALYSYWQYARDCEAGFKGVELGGFVEKMGYSAEGDFVLLPRDLMNRYDNTRYYFRRPLIPGAKEVLSRLKSLYRIVVLSTSRDPVKKKMYIKRVVPDAERVFVVDDNSKGGGKASDIKEIARDFNISPGRILLLDDQFRHLRAGLDVGANVVRMRPKYSRALPKDLRAVREVSSIYKFENLVCGNDSRSISGKMKKSVPSSRSHVLHMWQPRVR